MNRMLTLLVLCVSLASCQVQEHSDYIVTSDIRNFWEAYARITSTDDSTLQYKYFDDLYLQRGTPGLKAIMRARNYTPQEYIHAINHYPEFWNSVRKNTLMVEKFSSDLGKGIENLKKIYPETKPAKIYFTIGALRTNGTTVDSLVLIGSELAFANKQTPAHEFPETLSHLRSFFDSDPGKDVVFLNIHEYVHTQQKTTVGYNLLAQTVLEGVAEFVTEKALDSESPNPQIEFGRRNDAGIKARYELEMFSPNLYNWIWNSSDNEFGMRDLAYYVGYRISEEYYRNASNKEKAIEEMIELDYNNEDDLVDFVERAGYFDKPLSFYKDAFEKSRPTVVAIQPFENNSQNVDPQVKNLTIVFSEPMNTRFRNFDYGPLGDDALLRIRKATGWSADGKSLTIEIEGLKHDKRYQVTIGPGFRNLEGTPLKEYLINFTTKE